MKYITSELRSGYFRVEINSDISDVIEKQHFPLKLFVSEYVSGEILDEIQLYPNRWYSDVVTNFRNFTLTTNTGNNLMEWKYNPNLHSDDLDQFFNLWISSRSKSKGIVLGAGTGEWGEWVIAVKKGTTQALLIEPDPANFPKLQNNFNSNHKVILDNCCVSTQEGIVDFWISPYNKFSTLDPNIIEKYFPGYKPEKISVKSKTINRIINEYKFEDVEWIRLDIEGYDDHVIKDLDFSLLNELKFICYEYTNLSEDRHENLRNFFELKGFTKELFFHDNVVRIK